MCLMLRILIVSQRNQSAIFRPSKERLNLAKQFIIEQAGVELGLTQAETVSLELGLNKG